MLTIFYSTVMSLCSKQLMIGRSCTTGVTAANCRRSSSLSLSGASDCKNYISKASNGHGASCKMDRCYKTIFASVGCGPNNFNVSIAFICNSSICTMTSWRVCVVCLMSVCTVLLKCKSEDALITVAFFSFAWHSFVLVVTIDTFFAF